MELIFRVKKLGPLNNVELSWKPLTVFIGPNNTGKTYMAYLIAGTFKNYPKKCPNVFDFLKENFENGRIRVKTRELERLLLKDWQNYLKEKFLGEFWENYFAIENEPISHFQIELKRGSERLSPKNFDTFSIEIDYGYFTINFSEGIYENILGNNICEGIAKFLNIPLKPFIIPSERGVYLIYRQWFVLKNRLMNVGESEKIDEILRETKFPVIFEEYLEFLNLLPTKRKSDKYKNILDFLHQKLLKGEINVKGDDFWFDSEASRVKIFGASSGVKSLLPFEQFLKVATENDLLVIDEPEIHLHPEAQVIFTIALAMAVNAGLKVLLTTHSPYIIDTLNFLLWAYEIRKETKLSKDGYSEFYELLRQPPFEIPEQSLINQDKVSLYFFSETGEVKNIKQVSDENLEVEIDWETFSRVSDELWDRLWKLGKIRDKLVRHGKIFETE